MTTLVLLPGLLCDEAVWRPQMEALEALVGIETVVPDYGAIASLGGMAEHVLATTAAPRFSLVGHSMGARVALEMLRRAPQRIERLCLMDTGVEPLPPGEAGETERARRLALLAVARRDGMRAMGREWARGMVHPARLGTPVFDAVLDMIERKTPQIFAAQIAALLARPDARDVLREARCDTLIACGRDDAWSPLERHEQMQALRPGARLAVIEDSGHMTTMEQPDAVSALLRDWLRRPLAGSN